MWRAVSLERPWSWERSKAGGEGDDRGWDGWMASLTQWTWVWASSRRCWRTGKPPFTGSQRVRHNGATEQEQQQYFHLQQTSVAGQVGSNKLSVNEKLWRWFCIGNVVHLLSYLSLKESDQKRQADLNASGKWKDGESVFYLEELSKCICI